MYTSKYKQKKLVCDIDKREKASGDTSQSITKKELKNYYRLIDKRLQKHVSNV